VTPCTEEAVIEDDNDDKTLDDFTNAVFKQKTLGFWHQFSIL